MEGAQGADFRLVIPAYSLLEPHETLVRARKRRLNLQNQVGAELRQIRRTRGYEDAAEELKRAAALLASSTDAEQAALEKTVTSLASTAELIPLSPDVIRHAYEVQDEFDLEPQDSFVLGSVLLHLGANQADDSYFVTRNSKDFDDPDIKTRLRTRGCELLTDFWAAARSVGVVS
jgi:hypothetical protein